MLAGSDLFTHYSRSPAATAVYPVFFIVLVAWTGLVRERGYATGVALALRACAPWDAFERRESIDRLAVRHRNDARRRGAGRGPFVERVVALEP